MSDTKHIPLRIEPAPNGGFIVSDAWRGDGAVMSGPIFACSSIGEALEFIRSRLAPEPLTGGNPLAGGVSVDGCTCDNCRAAREAAPNRCDTCGKPGYLACEKCPDLVRPR